VPLGIGLNAEVETYIREQGDNGVSMDDLKNHFPILLDKVEDIINEVVSYILNVLAFVC
jgi:hypothetical protein